MAEPSPAGAGNGVRVDLIVVCRPGLGGSRKINSDPDYKARQRLAHEPHRRAAALGLRHARANRCGLNAPLTWAVAPDLVKLVVARRSNPDRGKSHHGRGVSVRRRPCGPSGQLGLCREGKRKGSVHSHPIMVEEMLFMRGVKAGK